MKRYLLLLVLCGCALVHPTNQPEQFAFVSGAVWRGGQPKLARQWSFLSSIGVSNVVKLNLPEKDDAEAARFGIKVQYFPISGWQQIFGPVDGQLNAALRSVTNGTYVHCQHGENRTGTLFILYRMKVCGWTKSQAIAEANKFNWQSSFPALKHFVNELPERF